MKGPLIHNIHKKIYGYLPTKMVWTLAEQLGLPLGVTKR